MTSFPPVMLYPNVDITVEQFERIVMRINLKNRSAT